MPPKKKIDKKLPKRKNQQKKPSLFNKYFTVIASVVSAFLLGVLVGGYFYIDSKDLEVKVDQVQNLQEQLKEEISFEDKTKALNIEYAKDNEINVQTPQKTQKKDPVFHYEEPDYGKVDEVIEEEKSIVNKIVPKVKEKVSQIFTSEEKALDNDKPKLVIIIDDVTTKSQIRKIKKIGYPVNVALLPPTKIHPNSDIIANELEQHMIHLPLQASSFKYEEDDTLHVGDSLARIEDKIASLKQIYPKAKYINNHTGSKFTANYEAMEKLFYALKKHDFYFIDSRTTAKTVAKKLAKKHDLHIYSRDVFLDNNKDKTYIQNQLKQAIAKAKRNGMAIAIGHPYNITLETLKNSKDLLDGLELIYVEQL